MVTTFPADVVQDLQDFILWQPDALETGVEAVYVMVSKPYGETNARGKYSGREYNTNKAGGFFNHTAPHMRVMRDLLKQHRSPMELMAMLR